MRRSDWPIGSCPPEPQDAPPASTPTGRWEQPPKSARRETHTSPNVSSLHHRSHYHLEQSAHTIVAAHRAVVELIVRERLPVIARVIHLISQRQAGQFRIELRIAAGHLVDRHIQ